MHKHIAASHDLRTFNIGDSSTSDFALCQLASIFRCFFLIGRKLAMTAKERHETVIAFMEALGVPSAVAHTDAEGIEQHVSEATLKVFRKFLKDKGGNSKLLQLSTPSPIVGQHFPGTQDHR